MKSPIVRGTGVFLALTLALSQAACGKDDKPPATVAVQSSATGDPLITESATPEPSVSKTPLCLADRLTDLSAVARKSRVARFKADGVSCIRHDIEWRYVEKTPGNYDWSDWDATIADIAADGLEVVLIPGYAPDHASGQRGCADKICSPANTTAAVNAYAKFFVSTVRHYNGVRFQGKVKAYEVWNEANLGQFWPNPDPKLYAKLLKATAKALTAAKLDITLLTSGLAKSDASNGNIQPADFFEQLYDNGIKGSFDAVAVHPYVNGVAPSNEINDDGWGQMLLIRKIMEKHGDAGKKIWATEFGYATGDAPEDVTPEEQAKYLKAAVELYRTYDWAGPFFWYTYQDTDQTYGLLDSNGDPKPAYEVFKALAK